MAKFRNIVVHHDDKIDAEIVVGILKKDLKDFIGYKDTIVAFLKSEAESEKTEGGNLGWWEVGYRLYKQKFLILSAELLIKN